MCFPVTEYRRKGKRMRCQVKGIGIFTFKGGEKMYKPKLLCGRGEGRQGSGFGGGDSERCLKWGGGVRGGFTNLSRNMRWVMAKVVSGGTEGVISPAPF